jgi:hypothetical protein
MRCARNMAVMRNGFKFWSANLKGRCHLGDPGIYGKIILRIN